MSHLKSLLPAFLILLLSAAGPVVRAEAPAIPAGPGGGSFTVGDFALQIARLTAEYPEELDNLNTEVALASLGRAGLKFKNSASDPLTEEEVSQFFRQMGLTLQVADPQQPVSSAKANALLSTFSGYVSSRAADPAKNLKVFPTRSVPSFQSENGIEACFINRGATKECKECCLAAGGTNKACGRSCGQARAGKASAVDPTP